MLLREFKWKEVSQANEPVLVDFWADWCAPCGNGTDSALTGEGLQSLQVNVDANQSLAAHFRISSIPTLLIFKSGEVVARYSGVTPEQTIRAVLKSWR